MTHVVAKPFNTVNRRLRVGAPVEETDDLSPHTFDNLKKGHWIVSDATKAAAKAIKEGDKIAEAENEQQASAEEANLQIEWEASKAGEPQGQWPISIKDDGVFGRVVLEDGQTVGVQVPGEVEARFYHIDQIDRIERTVSGKYQDSVADVRPRRR